MRSQLSRDKILTGVHTAEDGTAVDFDGRFTAAGMPGVAFYLMGWAQEWTEEGYTLACAGEDAHRAIHDPLAKDDDGHVSACWLYNEPEQVDRTDQVIAVMVGDDREHIVDVSDLTEIDPDAYCSGCGQVGCEGDFRHA
jgi:hypothetical protein